MRLYLQSIQPDDFVEINQAAPLAGIYTTPFDFLKTEAPVKETLQSLLEVMDDKQHLIVHCISSDFRSMLTEARKLQALDQRIVLAVPGSAQGLMALKACRTMKLPVVCANLYDSGQVLLAASQSDTELVIDLDAVSLHGDGLETLAQSAQILKDGKDRLMASGISSPRALREAAALGIGSLSAGADVYRSLLYSVLTQAEMENIREQWLMAYTADSVLD